MASLNNFQIIGNLGADPELRYTPSGKAVINIRVAVNRRTKDSQGEWQDETLWLRIVDWNERAERLAEQLKKGNLIYCEGPLKVEDWTGRDGENRYTLEIRANKIFSLEKRDRDGSFSTGGVDEPATSRAPMDSDADLPDLADQIPF